LVLFTLLNNYLFGSCFLDIVIGFATGSDLGVLSGIFLLGLIVPTLAVSVRRLHDTNRSGWWLLIGFIPLINIVYLVFLLQDSDASENKYGPNPKITEV